MEIGMTEIEQLHNCTDCGSTTFKVATRRFVGEESDYVGEVICTDCGERFGPPAFSFEIPKTNQ